MNLLALSNLKKIAEVLEIDDQIDFKNDTQVMKVLEEACLKEGRFISDKGKEISLHTVALEVGDVLYKKNASQLESWQRMQKTIQKRLEERKEVSKHYVNSFHDKIDEVIPQLDIAEAGVLFELILQMNLHSDGFLMQDGEYLIQEDLIALTGLGKTTLTKYLKNLKKLGILDWTRKKMTRVAAKADIKKKIKKGDTVIFSANAYQINKLYHWMGKFNEEQMNMNFTKTYKLKAQELTEELSLESKGLLYMIMTKIHHQTYFLSNFPNHDLRQDENKSLEWNMKNNSMNEVDHMTRADLLKEIGKSESAMKRYIKELENNGVLAPFGRGSKEKYMMNPELFGRSDTNDHEFTYYDAVKYQFKQLQEKHKK